MPAAVVVIEAVRIIGEVRLEEIEMAVEIVVADADAHARLLGSRHRSSATPRTMPSSRNVPSWLLMNSRLGVESQAT